MADLREFKRGLDEESLSAVDKFFASSIGQAIKNASDINICIRDNYINVYWHGCSILKYAPLAKSNRFLIHKKYLPSQQGIALNANYANMTLNSDESDLVCDACGFKYRASIIEKPNSNLLGYVESDGEKKALTTFLRDHREEFFLLDLEIAFSRMSNSKKGEERPVANRVDMVLIDACGSVPQLQLVEVKLDTDPRLRSTKTPEIVDQMERYKAFLSKSGRAIRDSYRQVSGNYLSLGLEHMVQPSADSARVLKEFCTQGKLDPIPYLLIIPQDKTKVATSMFGRDGKDHLACLATWLRDQCCGFHKLSMKRPAG